MTPLPNAKWELALAKTVACLLEKGMPEEQVEGLLGRTFYRWRANSLGGTATYPEYRLLLHFSYPSGTLQSAHYARQEAAPGGGSRFRVVQELDLTKPRN
jgi:hypothetical protein